MTEKDEALETIAAQIDLYARFVRNPKEGNPELQAKLVMDTIIKNRQDLVEEILEMIPDTNEKVVEDSVDERGVRTTRTIRQLINSEEIKNLIRKRYEI